MAAKNEEAKAEAPAEAPKKKLPIKAIGAVAVVMIIEAVAVFMVAGKSGPQSAAAAPTIEGGDHADMEATVEIPLVDDRFQNMQTGRVWIWDVSAVLKVKQKNEAFIAAELERRSAEIGEGVSMVIRRAQHMHLKEPGLETINRQLLAYVNQALGKDPDGKDRVERILIPKCKGYAAD